MTMPHALRPTLIAALLLSVALCSTAAAQTKLLVVGGGNNPSKTRFKHFVTDLKGVVMDGSDAVGSGTRSLTTARANARKIEDALQAGYSVILPPNRIAVADDNNDQVDIQWPQVYGLALIGTGFSNSATFGNGNTASNGYPEVASMLVHIDNPDRAHYDECILQYAGYGGEIRCGFCGLDERLVVNSDARVAAKEIAGVAIRFANVDNPPGSKCVGTANIVGCQVGAQFTYLGPLTGISGATVNMDTGNTSSSTAQAGTATTITLRAAASAPDKVWFHQSVALTGGAGEGQVQRILGWDETTKVATTSGTWSPEPDSTSQYKIVKGEEQHADHMEWEWFYCRQVETHYQVMNNQSMDHHINMYTNSGTPDGVGFDFVTGGDLLVDYAYAPRGTLLRIGPRVTTNQGDFRITKIRRDTASLASAPETILLDNQSRSSNITVRMGGLLADSSGAFDQRQLFRSKNREGRLDLQSDVTNLGSEKAAYPIRPIKGQAVADFYTTTAFTSPDTTKLWFDPNDRVSGWNITDGSVVAAGDKAAKQSFVEYASGVGPALRIDGCNWRDILHRNSDDNVIHTGTTGAPAAPTELTGIDDLTIMAVANTDTLTGTGTLLSYENAAGSDTTGFQLKRVNDKFKFEFGASAYVESQAIETDRWYLIIARRDGATGTCYITVDGITNRKNESYSADTLPDPDPAGPLVIGGKMSSGTASSHWSRKIGPIFIDLASWETWFDGSVVTATTNANGTVLTCTGYTPTAADIGKRLTILGGTNFTQRQVTVTNYTSSTLTVNADVSEASSATGMIGRLESDKQIERVNYLRQWGVW